MKIIYRGSDFRTQWAMCDGQSLATSHTVKQHRIRRGVDGGGGVVVLTVGVGWWGGGVVVLFDSVVVYTPLPDPFEKVGRPEYAV